jgi:hypothetical protein
MPLFFDSKMSTFDQTSERYWTAIGNAIKYKQEG